MLIKDIKLDIIKPSKAKRLAIHIRKNRCNDHPAIIIGEDGKSYLFIPMTSNPISNTKKLKKNPNPLYPNRPSYVIFRMRSNKKGAFTAPLNWQLEPSDYKMIEEYAKRKIK